MDTWWPKRSVFVTGHTGFKGSWLSLWLWHLGARVSGYALVPKTPHDLFFTAAIEDKCHHVIGDVRDSKHLAAAMREAQPEVVFHLAAQPLVGYSYRHPAETFDVNVMGTVNLLDAVRATPSVKAVVVVTSDKCYLNLNTGQAYHEGDRLGGHDPYSSSKAAAELVVASYRNAFFQETKVGVATVRAGNVIGGGDWSEGRILPDCYRCLKRGEPVVVRQPASVRPWQHVLEPLCGYMSLAERLFCEPAKWEGAWNFGPEKDAHIPVGELADLVIKTWGGGSWQHVAMAGPQAFHEAKMLHLDITKAKNELAWRPRLTIEDAVAMTSAWYRHPTGDDAFSLSQIDAYQRR